MKYPDHVRGDSSDRVDVGDDKLLRKDAVVLVLVVAVAVVLVVPSSRVSTFRHEEEEGASFSSLLSFG